MAASPFVRPPLSILAKAGSPLANSPAPMVPTPPATSPLRKKERRLEGGFQFLRSIFYILFFYHLLLYLLYGILLGQ